jgi:hypothetical protein
VAEQSLDARAQGAEDEPVAGRERRRHGAVFGARAEVARAEDDGAEAINVFGLERGAGGESHFDSRSRSRVNAPQARGERRGVVGDDEVSAAQVFDEGGARRVADSAARVNDEEFGVRRSLHRAVCGDHAAAPSAS